MKKIIQIMLIEDNAEYRDVIDFAIGRESDMAMSDSFGTAEMAIASFSKGEAPVRPDVILLDLRLPGMNGLDAILALKERAEDVKILVLSQSDDEADIMRAITLGVAGYLLKSSTSQQIKEAVRSVVKGDASLDPRVARYLLDKLKGKSSKSKPKKLLSDREMEILELLADGDMKKHISDKLYISYSTVDAHVRHIYEKLDVKNAPAAVRKAYRMGLFTSDEWF